MKTTNGKWDLSLLYKNDNDPQIEKDMKAIEKAYSNFEKKYKGKDFTSTPAKLLQVLKDNEQLHEMAQGGKPWWYFALKKDLNAKDGKAEAMATQQSERLTKAGNKIAFFSLTIAKIPKSKQRVFLSDPSLSRYSYLLKVIFDKSQYNLSEAEEQLTSLLMQPSYEMWISGQSKLLSGQTVLHKGKTLPIEEALGILATQPKVDRYALHASANQVFKNISHFSEAEINAIYTFKKIMDERRGLKKPYSSTIISHETDEKTVESLVSMVTKSFNISQRFFKLHAKLLKQKKLSVADRAVSIGKIEKEFDFDSAVSLVKRGFAKIDDQYVKIFDSFLEKGQIDVNPKQGKKGGAYCWGNSLNPIYVFLNHTGNIRSVETLAHEMGHAFHGELTKSQPAHYRGHSTATAEVASTFFEQVVGEELENELSDKERAALLHGKLQGDISTIFRQIAFFNFELELHQRIRKEGQLPKEEIAKLMSKHLKSYMGDAVEVTDDDGYFFVHLSHMRRFFYVYSYAYGLLISKALFEKWKEDKSYAKKIEKFLKAGDSMSPKDIFKSIGINTADPKFFGAGLKSIEKDIEKLEKLTKKL
jgi:oligoendopeptidase F